ncbi:MAG: PD40 domain-containing protein [Myxococcales bacterium]|nr:PD40 domain-containing protein [Myxococcales bacterium]
MATSGAVRELRPDLAGEVDLVRLSQDGARIAFVLEGGADPGIYAGPVAGPYQRIVAAEGRPVADLALSSSGAHLAYRIPAPEPGGGDRVGWALATAPGERGSLAGSALAWSPTRERLFVGDGYWHRLTRVEPTRREAHALAAFVHTPHAGFAPRIAPSPDGSRVAFTTYNTARDTVYVHSCGRRGQPLDGALPTPAPERAPDGGADEDAGTQLTWIPGASVHVYPLWSPRGGTLALFLVHVEQQKSGLVVVRDLAGDGEIFYEHDAIDGALAPAWSPSGRRFAFYRHETRSPDATHRAAAGALVDGRAGARCHQPEAQALTLLDLGTRTLSRLALPGEALGELRFRGEDELVVDGGRAAYVVGLPPA